MKPLISDEPDSIDLELLRLDEVGDPDARARIAQAAAGPLADEDAEIAAFAAYWAEHRPALAADSRQTWRSWWRPALALAAAVLLAVGVGTLWPTPEAGYRPMGGLPVDLQASRGTVTLQAPYRLLPGDDLHVSFVAPSAGRVDAWTIQEDGQMSMLARSEEVSDAKVFSLYGAARLDDYEGREWLVVQLTDDPRTDRQLRDAARQMLPEPTELATDRTWVVEVTRWR